MADTPQEVKLVKTRPDGTGTFLTYAAAAADYTDGHFTIQNMDDSVLAADGAIEASKSYKLVVYVKDGGAYDIDPTECSIVDPLALIKTSQKQSSSSGRLQRRFRRVSTARGAAASEKARQKIAYLTIFPLSPQR